MAKLQWLYVYRPMKHAVTIETRLDIPEKKWDPKLLFAFESLRTTPAV